MFRWADSFTYTDTTILTVYDNLLSQPPLLVGGGRFGTNCLQTSTGDGTYRSIEKIFDSQQTWCVHFARKPGRVTDNVDLIFLSDGGTVQFRLRQNSSGKLEVWRGTSTALLATSTPSLTPGIWQQIQLKVKVHGSTGTVDVLVDSVSWIHLTGQNTAPSGNNSADRVKLASGQGSGDKICDYYICDGTAGDGCNDLAGDVRVDPFELSGDSSPQDYALSSGANGYTLLRTLDDDTSYLSDATVGHRSLFDIADVGTGASIVGVQAWARARKDDTGVRQIGQTMKSGSSVQVGSAATLTPDYLWYQQAFPQDPATSAAWTASAFNAAKLGFDTVT